MRNLRPVLLVFSYPTRVALRQSEDGSMLGTAWPNISITADGITGLTPGIRAFIKKKAVIYLRRSLPNAFSKFPLKRSPGSGWFPVAMAVSTRRDHVRTICGTGRPQWRGMQDRLVRKTAWTENTDPARRTLGQNEPAGCAYEPREIRWRPGLGPGYSLC